MRKKETLRQQAMRRGMIDLPFLILTLLLMFSGLVMLFSASYARAYAENGNAAYFFIRQAGFAAFGIVVVLAVTRVPVQWIRKASMPLLIVSLFLLVAVLAFGTEEKGATRWIKLFGISFQPSEITKLAVVLTFAALISGYGDKMKTFYYGVMPFSAILTVVFLLLALEPHLSCIIIIGATGAAMMFMGGTRCRWFVLLGIIAVIGLLLYLRFRGYASERITAWRDPESDPADSGYQILQSLYAIGSGGLWGLGLGKSRQKYLYLPFQYNDYIFAVICEELGLVGAMAIVALFAVTILRGYWIALNARDRFSTVFAAGLVTLIAVQTILNLCVVTNLLPSTGIALPFFSYGGTALAVNLGEMGIVLGISRGRNRRKIQEA